MRINRYIAAAGICSRRKADELIQNGNVKVNGAVLTSPGYDVKDGDTVSVNGRVIEAENKKVYILLNKPVGYVTTVNDELGRPTVMELVNDVDVRLFPVGRLDYNTSGIIVMTNDGEFAYKLTHPKHELPKTYRAHVAGYLSKQKCHRLINGVDIGGYKVKADSVDIVKDLPKSTIVDITIHEGKNRQVRKMFAAVENQVQELQRIAIGDIKIGRLSLGHYRKLSREEIIKLQG
ncbi:MAG: pseudouridine synthase [Eubacterium sp.]|nr:pseudouridine synthase [Eubacterium sp.]